MAAKRRHRTRRRRRNPTAVPVLFANGPRRPRRRRRRGKGRMPAALARYWAGKRGRGRKSGPKRRRRGRRRNPTSIMMRRAHSPIRRRRRRRGGLAHVKMHRRRRRRNPMRLRSIFSIARFCFFGGLGIVAARLGKHYYGKFIGGKVVGDGSSKLRVYGNEVLNLFAMAFTTIAIERGLKKVGLRDEDRRAFLYGGLGETGRNGIGVIVKALRPSTNLATYGLDGRGGHHRLSGLETSDSFQGLETSDSFMGLEEAESFQGMGGAKGRGIAAHPYAASY